jgi:hypothetical protein
MFQTIAACPLDSGLRSDRMFNQSATNTDKSSEATLTHPAAPPETESAKQAPQPELPYRPYAEKAVLPELPYRPYAEKAVLPGPLYKPYSEKSTGHELPYEPYKGI